MKLSKFMFTFATLALAVASAASTYHISLFQPSTIGGKVLKAGDYKIELNGDKALIKSGKTTVEAPVKVENGTQKYDTTSVRYTTASGKSEVDEIRLGGTTTKLVFTN